MGEVIEINQKRYFTLDDARALMPIVKRITEQSYREVEALTTQLNFIPHGERHKELESKIEKLFDGWMDKIHRLGCETKGVWLVDFDNGEGYFCWQYGEGELKHFHSYHDGFQGRVEIN